MSYAGVTVAGGEVVVVVWYPTRASALCTDTGLSISRVDNRFFGGFVLSSSFFCGGVFRRREIRLR